MYESKELEMEAMEEKEAAAMNDMNGHGARALTDVMTEVRKAAERASAEPGESAGVSTGFRFLDHILEGMKPGQLVVVGSRPSEGKTAFALNISLNAAASRVPVTYFSPEMDAADLTRRIIAMVSEADISRLASGKLTHEEWERVNERSNDLAKLDISIDDRPRLTVAELRDAVHALAEEDGGTCRLVVLDSLQSLTVPTHRPGDHRCDEISEITRELKALARETGTVILALSQLNRSCSGSGAPQMTNLRDSGSIEHDADVVMLLDRSATAEEACRDDRPPEGVTHVIVAKNRTGCVGMDAFAFLPRSCKFLELDSE